MAFKIDHAAAAVLVSIIAIQAVLFLAVVAALAAKYYKLSLVLKGYNEFMLLARIRSLYKEDKKKADAGRSDRQLNQPLSSASGHTETYTEQQLDATSIFLGNKVSIAADDVQIKFHQLEIGEELGKGAFGKVFQAALTDWPSDGEQNTVAVKTVEDTDPSKVIKFLKEGLLMKNFSHPNVLKLLGLTFDRMGQPLIVLPFMANGDLKSFVKMRKQELTHTQLMMFAYHVALGMEYLAGQKFVHRDLAARNCLVDDEFVTKISDFGLSRDLDESDYYTSGEQQAKLPVKWMAPESMERLVYSTKSDVWSYGVLLWELFSRGQTPYPEIQNRDVYLFLKTGKRMDPPRFCPIKISDIMRRCWLESPKKRPSFRQIAVELEKVVTTRRTDAAPPAEPRRESCSVDIPELPVPGSKNSSRLGNEDRGASVEKEGGSEHIAMEIMTTGKGNQ
ncbi:hepatocyte growth factor receptor-like [Acanthaster planci]|uniref:Hepatocyte growth factor receptor-like n=1 Tax=Acanthaster planci TaxID=133434 RepID=A0A8B7XK21_ACAPL|nr:hepatocyte growth factor receptor-like [Acanthaster planci]XP_022081156.1 hepatocyte growth factor receptor-like [Acanthaster planci]XP_022081157.1 hepatocyte growth factor receptor-like [Acanthaster planci]XP_022081158.1 hepatocyte growth factor receptor-like [Acanthaster planci]XP_022081159.1 hepatocyte growth factor receptor-like [Acanthaster planci]